MAIAPIGNSGYNYFYAGQNGAAGKVGSAGQAVLEELNKPCQT